MEAEAAKQEPTGRKPVGADGVRPKR